MSFDPPSPTERGSGGSRDREQLNQLRRALDRDYVSIGELSLWLTCVLALLVGMHFVLLWIERPSRDSAQLPQQARPVEVATWSGPFPGGFAMLQRLAESEDVADQLDARWDDVFGQPVRSYWLTLFAFDEVPPAWSTDLTPLIATAHLGDRQVTALPLPSELAPHLRLQLQALTAPLHLRSGHETRARLFFPRHEAHALTRLHLEWPQGRIELVRHLRPLRALQDFRSNPSRAFFESAHNERDK